MPAAKNIIVNLPGDRYIDEYGIITSRSDIILNVELGFIYFEEGSQEGQLFLKLINPLTGDVIEDVHAQVDEADRTRLNITFY